uniref:Phytase-like domain-containing protein n=1 Tax=Entomoneis paludosa TaxID=265537 RepID=A0A7S2YKK9_9STRA|mmetsp:Transcript_37053/g.77005  ORF Transcript_37053/g.77005 Transcript_37053/m.77005 type:complete len:501 (+) Transcript_37053:87-1589(+)|eukprot:CAMPEP_0172476720 /NCGR_PEP_ID=MMETSP1065-20121228/70522_1 /TAXON_ID=265537 /ORGANISM="Amphiprora paludosa, Strain CCMP125" /LENGTH=500 /DNA_ID=CAMNT_0013234949 /DNA_START=1511 /DNA_END=3013 /DNA_ORIENTATION=+
MKVSSAALLIAITASADAAKSGKKGGKKEGMRKVYASNSAEYQNHYLVGLLNYPNADIPDILDGVTSGTYLNGFGAPYPYVPSVGFSDIEPFYEGGEIVRGEFFCLSDNGYGSSTNSADYALNIVHMKIQKPFTYRHGEGTYDAYTPTENLGTALIHDPNGLIQWENGADIQVTYDVPDSTWDAFKDLRVLTGRDFDVEGLAVINENLAIVGDELMPAIFAVNPTTGVVLSPFVRTPDIDEHGSFNGKYLSTRGDKVHCTIEALEKNECLAVDSEVVDNSMYRKHDPSGGYEGFSVLADGSIAAFLEKTSGDSTLGDEPGVRVYRVDPGNGSPEHPPSFTDFLGYYPFELNAGNIADVSPIPGSNRLVAVIERNGFPSGQFFPAPVMPANKLCVVDLLDVDENMVMTNKKCILNYHSIDDPWDVDGNGILKYAQTQVTNEQVIVVDDYCIIAGTDTNFPFTNQFGVNVDELPFGQEVTDTRFMVVCFLEPIFNLDYPLMD